jgi:peptidyl-prolyl cis-trans isomerase D
MIQLLRRLIDSKLGVAFALAFLVLIALAFAAGDMASLNGSSSSSGDNVATVGSSKVSALRISQATTNAFEGLKKDDPSLTMKAFVLGGGFERVVEQVLGRFAVTEFGEKYGIIASDRLIDSEINKMPFKSPDGSFSDSAFRQFLQQQGVSEKALRDDIAQGLIARQLVTPAAAGSSVPQELLLRYASLLNEQRSGAIGLLPSAVFAPKTPPTDAEMQAFYAKNRDRFIRPERRVIRFTSFGDEELKGVPAATDAEIAERYNANKSEYIALETRQITQLIAPTETAANAIIAEVRAGKKLEQVAAAKGLGTAALEAVSKEALTKQASAAVAEASFAAAKGTIAPAARSALGWHVMLIASINKRPERPLAQVKAEIAAQIAAEKRRIALNDLSTRYEQEFDEGGNLADAAKELGLTLQSTAAMTADGQVYGQPGATTPPVLARILQTAFAMEKENAPQIAEVETGKTFVIFDVTSIIPSAAAPLAEIRNDVMIQLSLEKGSAAAKAAADKVVALARKGTDLGAAFATLGVPLPPVDRVDMPRAQLAGYKPSVPAPLMLLFSMAKGTVKLQAAPNNRGWYITTVKDIVPGKVEPKDPGLAMAKAELSKIAGQEFAEQLSRAINAEIGIKRNDSVITALRTQLSGGN